MILRRTTAGSHFAPGSKILTERLTHRGIYDAEDNACDSRLPSPQGGLRCRDCGHCHRGAGAHASASGRGAARQDSVPRPRRLRRSLPQHRDRDALHVPARRVVRAGAWLGGAVRSVRAPRSRPARGGCARCRPCRGIELKDIGAIVVNTITGLAIPSLDSKLMNRLDLPASVERLPVFGLGCAGGVAGLARSARYAQAMSAAHVLFLTVDLCSLCLRGNDPSMAVCVSAALFGDGAAGVVLRNTKRMRQASGGRGRIIATRDHFWRDTEHIMGWDIRHDGFGVVLSPDLPLLLRHHLGPAVQAFLDASGMNLGEFNGFLFHPGGAKVLKTVQSLLMLRRDDLAYSWAVLRDFGNMSSPTALFTLDQALKAGASGPHLMAAFGPGFSAYFLAVEL